MEESIMDSGDCVLGEFEEGMAGRGEGGKGRRKEVLVKSYALGPTVHQGRLGKVRVGQHVETGLCFAVRILDKDEIRRAGVGQQITREINVMQTLHHRNVLNLVETFWSSRKLFIVTDLVRGVDMNEWLRAGAESAEKFSQGLPLPVVRKVLHQLVDGVGYCHQRGVVHWDLKPENIMIAENGMLKISSFGISTMLAADVVRSSYVTLEFAAPEVLNRDRRDKDRSSRASKGYDGKKADIWSCGVILYLLLCGKLPFKGLTPEEIHHSIESTPLSFPRRIPREVIDLNKHLLRRDPKTRYSANDIKRHPWFVEDYDTRGNNPIPPEYLESIREQYSLSSQLLRKAEEKEPFSKIPIASPHRPPTTEPRTNGMTIKSETPLSGPLSPNAVRSLNFSSSGISERNSCVSETPNSTPRKIREMSGAGYLVTNNSHKSTTSSRSSLRSLPEERGYPRLRQIQEEYQSLEELIGAALGPEPELSVSSVTSRLSQIDMDCLEDVAVVAETMGDPDSVKHWFGREARLPGNITASITQLLFHS
mmetsp:Transcript_14963/g.30412  ORF Transcript_14963/g.30412 Transcript_14963/m.30412 type:complete len:536 (-) Transcript_14963:139-1746(-)